MSFAFWIRSWWHRLWWLPFSVFVFIWACCVGIWLARHGDEAARAHRLQHSYEARVANEHATLQALLGRCYGDGGQPTMGFGDPPEVVCIGKQGLLWSKPQRWEIPGDL